MTLATKAVRTGAVDPDALVDRFSQHLVAEGRAKNTVSVYTNSVSQFFAFLANHIYPTDLKSVDSADVESFIAYVYLTRSAGTAYIRYWGLKQFFDWLAIEGTVGESPMSSVSQPRKPTKRSKDRIERRLQRVGYSIKEA